MPHSKTLSGSLLLVLLACSSTEPPDSAPAGTEIVFQAGDSSSADIYVVNADGSGPTRLTHPAHAECDPSWSGDGPQIYIISSTRRGLHLQQRLVASAVRGLARGNAHRAWIGIAHAVHAERRPLCHELGRLRT